MISKKTAMDIWIAYDEIEKAKKLIKDMARAIERREDPNPLDAFGRRRDLQLGVPSGDRSTTLYNVRPKLALSIMRAHIAEKQKELVEANESARLELDNEAKND